MPVTIFEGEGDVYAGLHTVINGSTIESVIARNRKRLLAEIGPRRTFLIDVTVTLKWRGQPDATESLSVQPVGILSDFLIPGQSSMRVFSAVRAVIASVQMGRGSPSEIILESVIVRAKPELERERKKARKVRKIRKAKKAGKARAVKRRSKLPRLLKKTRVTVAKIRAKLRGKKLYGRRFWERELKREIKLREILKKASR